MCKHTDISKAMNSGDVMKARFKILAAIISAAAMGMTAAHAEYPEQPVKLVVPFAPGGGTDTIARLVSKRLGEAIGQPVIVENRAGAAGTIGTRVVASSEPDGYTTLFASSGHAINPSLYKNLGYDTLKDLTCLGQAAAQHIILVVHPSVPANNVQEFIAYAKANPGKLSFGSSSQATALPMELLMAQTGIDMVSIPYKGSSPVMTDLISGRIQASFGALATIGPFIRDGKVRALGLGDNKRSPSMPDLPTIAEQGVPGFQAILFNGMFVPSATPKPVVDKLGAELQAMFKDPEFRAVVTKAGFDPVGSTPDECNNFVQSEVTKWAEVAKRAGITPN